MSDSADIPNMYSELKKQMEQQEQENKPEAIGAGDEQQAQPAVATAETVEYPSHDGALEAAALATAEKQAQEYQNRYLRLQAEMENLRRRTEREVESARKYALEKFALELLSVADSLERGLSIMAQGDELAASIHEGMLLTAELLQKTLQKFAIVAVDPLGKPFNPELHEAMSMQADPTTQANTVLQVLQKGYTLNGRLLRPALVVIAQA